MDWIGLDWVGSPGGRGYRAPYGANNRRKMEGKYLRQVSANVLADMRRRSVKSHTVLQILAERGT